MLRFGIITEIDTNTGYARVKFLDDDIVSDWLQVCVMGALENKYFHTFDINEQVACLMDDNSEDGVILGALFNNKTAPDGGNKDIVRVKFSDDSSIEYNRSTHEYNIDIKGKINIKADSDVNIEAANANIETTVLSKIQSPSIELTGNVIIGGNLALGGSIGGSGGAPISGDLEITGQLKGASVEVSGEVKGATVTDGVIDLATHKHSGVQTGPGVSGPAIP